MAPIAAIVSMYVHIYILMIYMFYICYMYDICSNSRNLTTITSLLVSTSMAMVPTPPMGSKTTLPSWLMARGYDLWVMVDHLSLNRDACLAS